MLSGYRIMWLMALFDLPVGSKAERRAATGFRNHLLDLGFEMAQFSVYLRWCRGKEHLDGLRSKVVRAVPRRGRVHLLAFTDRQFENMVRVDRGLEGRKKPHRRGQLVLF